MGSPLASTVADPYRVLGLTAAASGAEIKAAYRALVKQHHPDAGGDQERIIALNAAWELLRDGELFRVSREIIRPFYQSKAERALDALRGGLAGLPCRIHKPEGAMFLWLWTPGIPGGSTALYQRLKQRGVLVVPGAQFFPGLQGEWAHRDECLRISYARDEAAVAAGMRLIVDEVRRSYG